MSKSPTRDAITDLFTGFSGQKNTLTIQRPYIEFCKGDHLAALLLSQILYWTDRTDDPDGWFAKSYDEWSEELYMSQYQVNRAINGDKRAKSGGFALKNVGVETKLKPSRFHGGGATLHYRIDMAVLQKAIHAFLGVTVMDNVHNAVINNVDNHRYEQTQQRYINNVDNHITETIAETTSEITAKKIAPDGAWHIGSKVLDFKESAATGDKSKQSQTPTPNSAPPPSPSHQDKIAMIEAWWETLPAKPGNVTNPYSNKTAQGQAENLIRLECTPADVVTYVKQQTGSKGFYHDKALSFTKVAADLPAWKKAQKRTYAHPSHRPVNLDEITTPSDEMQALDNMPPHARAAFEQMMQKWTS